jgi:UDP-N-acetylmuramoyl-tripeptide--D-alanyl-D-alanine ligase
MVIATAPSGLLVVDDTFNANPAGAASALTTLATLPISGQRVVITPGMIELGREQDDENELMARRVFELGAQLVIVGRTNVRALRRGFGPSARYCETRDAAVEWVRASLGASDGVLYSNDLPDHYP